MNHKKRMKNIDIARGIAMVLVVMGHCDNFKFWSIEKFSSLFFMQLFIFLSGIFFSENCKSLKELFVTIKKKCLPIYKYYLKYEILFYLLTNLFLKIGFYNINILYGGKSIGYISLNIAFVKNIVKIIFLMGREPFCGAFWFLISLIFIIIEYSCINYLADKFFRSNDSKKLFFINIMIWIMFLIGCIMNYTGFNIPRLSPSFTLILFFHLGNLYRKKGKIQFDNLALFVLCVLTLNILYYFGTISMNSNTYSNPIFLIICSFSGIYMVMYLSKFIEKNLKSISNILAYVGKNTLPIVALQFISFKFIMFIQYKLNFISYEELGILTGANNNNLIYILYVICGIFIPLVFSYMIQKMKIYIRKGEKKDENINYYKARHS